MAQNVPQVVAVALHGPQPAVMGWPTPSANPWQMRESEKSSTFIWWVGKVSLYLEESKQKNMTQAKFKPGNHIFYRNLDGGNDPHVVLEVRHRGVSRGGWWVRIDDGRWVKSKNCQLQEEWRKENDQ